MTVRLTRRPLPAEDRTIDALAHDDRRAAAHLWLGRASGELESTRAFRWIADACRTIGAHEIVPLAERAVFDEERHGEICTRVAAAYHGGDVVPPVSPPSQVPLRTPDDPELAVALYLVDASCLSETIGATTIESCLRATTAPLAKAALRELLTDEIEHARMGWAYLGAPHLGRRRAAELGPWLPTLFAGMLDFWKALVLAPTPPAILTHGCLPFERLEPMVLGALADLALPGFAHVGVDTAAGAEFVRTRSRS